MAAMFTSGGAGNVTSADIVDATISNDDIANATIAVGKMAVGAVYATVESTAGTSHSLTTVAGQKVIVIAKGYIDNVSTANTVSLSYNAVVKDSIVADGTANPDSKPFCLVWHDTPGAATQNVTVETNGGGALSSVVIMVIKST